MHLKSVENKIRYIDYICRLAFRALALQQSESSKLGFVLATTLQVFDNKKAFGFALISAFKASQYVSGESHLPFAVGHFIDQVI